MLLMIAPCIINSLTNFVSAEVNKLQHVPVQQGYIKLQPTTENIMDGGAWWATVHGVAKSQIQLRNFAFFHAKYTINVN